jgi:hypothetical protein
MILCACLDALVARVAPHALGESKGMILYIYGCHHVSRRRGVVRRYIYIYIPDESKDAIRTSAANLLRRSRLPNHKNITTNERKAIDNPRKDKTRIVMKADKGNCFVVMDRNDYDDKMQELRKTPMRKYLNPPSKESNAN